MKKEIYFEKDLFTLKLRIILLFILGVLISLPVTISFFGNNNSVNWILIFILSIVFTLILLTFMTHTLAIFKNQLILKNIYGFKIKTFNLNENYSRKIDRKNNNLKDTFLWSLFRKKYSSLINIKFESVNKKVNINGQILSLKGLNKLITKTKKKNIC